MIVFVHVTQQLVYREPLERGVSAESCVGAAACRPRREVGVPRLEAQAEELGRGAGASW